MIAHEANSIGHKLDPVKRDQRINLLRFETDSFVSNATGANRRPFHELESPRKILLRYEYKSV